MSRRRRRRRVLAAGLYHETHTFVPARTPLADFAVLRGEEMTAAEGGPSPLGGALEAARACGWEVVPAVDYRAQPGGTPEGRVPEAWWAEFRGAAERALREGPLDAVFLVLHGAMATDACRDVEGELLARIGSLPGLAGSPVGGVTDLHANVSERMARHSDALVTYRENPHADARAAAVRAVRVLDGLLAAGRRGRTHWARAPLILPPPATGTGDDPMRTLEALARRFEAENPCLLAVNVHAGFAFADTPDTGVTFTAVAAEGDAEGDGAASAALSALCRAALDTPRDPPNAEVSPEEALRRLAALPPGAGPVLLVEPSDNIGAGAPGEGVTLLRPLTEAGVEDAALAVSDPDAVAALASLGVGGRRTVRIGGKGSPLYGPGWEGEVTLVSRSDGRFRLEDPYSHLASMAGGGGAWGEMGPCAVVRHGGVLLLLTSRPTPPFDLGQWRSQGIHPERLAVIGVKAAVGHRRAYDPVARAAIFVQTPGPCSSDLRTLPYRHVRRPVRPLDDV